jgi:hypothetical protein
MINLEGCLFKMTGVRLSIYPTYRIAIPLCIAAAPPPYSLYLVTLPSYPALFSVLVVVAIGPRIGFLLVG